MIVVSSTDRRSYTMFTIDTSLPIMFERENKRTFRFRFFVKDNDGELFADDWWIVGMKMTEKEAKREFRQEWEIVGKHVTFIETMRTSKKYNGR